MPVESQDASSAVHGIQRTRELLRKRVVCRIQIRQRCSARPRKGKTEGGDRRSAIPSPCSRLVPIHKVSLEVARTFGCTKWILPLRYQVGPCPALSFKTFCSLAVKYSVVFGAAQWMNSEPVKVFATLYVLNSCKSGVSRELRSVINSHINIHTCN